MTPPSVNTVSLPPDLFDVYRFYKKCTAAARSWLTCHSDIACKNVDHLILAAESVVDQGIGPPRELYTNLRDALEARIRIARYYHSVYQRSSRGKDEHSKGHEHFTNILRQVILLLFPRSGPVPTKVHQFPRLATDTKPNMPELSNKYAVLAPNNGALNLVSVQEVDATGRNDEESFNAGEASSLNAATAEHDIAPLEDDTLAIDMEFMHYVMEFDIIFSQIKNFWVEAETGASSVMLAAWLTNAAYHLVNSMVMKAQRNLAIPSHEAFLQKLQLCKPFLDAHLESMDEVHVCQVFGKGQGFSAPFAALKDWTKSVWEAAKPREDVVGPPLRAEVFENAGKMVAEQNSALPGEESQKREIECYFSLITSLYERVLLFETGMKDGGSSLSLGARIYPVLPPFMWYFCEHIEISTSFVYGLQLHPEIFKSFREQRATTNCRTLALRFAKDVYHALQPVLRLTVDCEKLGYVQPGYFAALIEFDGFLQGYVKEKRWDLYYQSPWTAGSNMISVHVRAADLGVRLCYSEGTLGAVLHLYHFMRVSYMMQENIALFDHLIRILRDVFFPGGLPNNNFYNHVCRFLGGKIDFARRSYASKFTDKRFALNVPDQLPSLHDKKRRLDAVTFSAFYTLDASSYDTDNKDFARFLRGDRKFNRSPPVDGINTKNGLRFTALLNELKSGVFKEFEGEFPIGKINWFAVYVTCRRVIDVFGEYVKKTMSEEIYIPPDLIGLKAIVGLLYTADKMEVVASPLRDRQHLPERWRESAQPGLLALRAAEDGKDLSKYLWDI